MVRGLDDDEAGFLDLVDQTKLAEESRILKEENEELEEYRKAVAKEQEERLLMEIKSIPNTPSAPLKVDSGNSVSLGLTKTSQKNHLQAFVKRKSTDKDGNSVKRTKSEGICHVGMKYVANNSTTIIVYKGPYYKYSLLTLLHFLPDLKKLDFFFFYLGKIFFYI